MAQGRRLNLILRGHVRSSFGDDGLRSIVAEMAEMFDLTIYVQTWNIVQNSLSWRAIPTIEETVDEGRVRGYLEGFNVKNVTVMDDSKISHVGNIAGRIGRTPCPVLGWKNMYCGMLVAARKVLGGEGPTGTTAQMRLDMLTNPFSQSREEILNFLDRDWALLNSGHDLDDPLRFIKMRCFLGIDNMSMASTENMHKFISYMYYDMDRILHVHRHTVHQEHIAFHERRAFLNWKPPSDPVH